jgi:DNA-binding Lrp family transcriptional regulator
MNLDAIDKKILLALQGDLGSSPEPYRDIAVNLNISEDEVLARIRCMLDSGMVRRLGAMIRHVEAGVRFNGMVVWKVDDAEVEEVGAWFASFPEVSHCYERPPFGRLGGTIFTMVHASSQEECLATIERMAQHKAIQGYESLFSVRELKKVSMTYFEDDE